MRGAMADDDTKRDTVAMLKRVQQQKQQQEELETSEEGNTAREDEENEQSTVEDDELARLLAAIGDDRFDLSSLSPEQQRHFLRAVHDGSLSRYIPIAVPWWVPRLARQHDEAAQEQPEREVRHWEPTVEKVLVDEVGQERSEQVRQPGPFVQSLPPLSSILTTEPSPALPYHLLELVYSYCYLYRLYNCDPSADLPAAFADLVNLSPSLTPAPAPPAHYQSTATLCSTASLARAHCHRCFSQPSSRFSSCATAARCVSTRRCCCERCVM